MTSTTMIRWWDSARGVQPVDGVGGEADRAVEPEGAVGLDDVVVDGLGNADERNAPLVKLVGDRQRAVAADDDERVEAEIVKRLDAACGVVDHAAGRTG